MNHVKTIKHLQMEQIHQLQKRSEGNEEQTEIGDIFQVHEDNGRSEVGDENEDEGEKEEEEEDQQNDEENERGGKSNRLFFNFDKESSIYTGFL
jgi:AT-binding transcription factor 1